MNDRMCHESIDSSTHAHSDLPNGPGQKPAWERFEALEIFVKDINYGQVTEAQLVEVQKYFIWVERGYKVHNGDKSCASDV